MATKKKTAKRKPYTVLDDIQIAACLVEAVLLGDEVAAEKFNISTRTLARHRQRLNDDAGLAKVVQYRLQQAMQVDGWAEQATETIRTALAYVRRFCEDGIATPDGVMAVTGALATLVDAEIAYKLLDANINTTTTEVSGSADQANGPLVATNTTGWGPAPSATA